MPFNKKYFSPGDKIFFISDIQNSYEDESNPDFVSIEFGTIKEIINGPHGSAFRYSVEKLGRNQTELTEVFEHLVFSSYETAKEGLLCMFKYRKLSLSNRITKLRLLEDKFSRKIEELL